MSRNRFRVGSGLPGASAAICLLALVAIVPTAGAQPDDRCEVPDNGSGTASFPPHGCSYVSPEEAYFIIDGLPAGTTIELHPIQTAFFCRSPAGPEPCSVGPGGVLGGEQQIFDFVTVFKAIGTGDLAGYSRVIALDSFAETHTGPITPGDPVQTAPADFFAMQGALAPGDLDFAQLQLVAGTGFGFPSPGFLEMTRHGPPGSDFAVDSFFDVTYQITFQGAPGGALDGLAGTTTGTVRIETVGERDRCIVVDDGTGTVELPPAGCESFAPTAPLMIIDGLPPGGEIELEPRQTEFVCHPAGCGQPGGNLGGEVEDFTSTFVLQLAGQGSTNIRRTLRLPVVVQTHTGPRDPGDPVQSFATDAYSMLGVLPPGDPDFDSLTLTAGTSNGMPSPGHTILEDLGDGTCQVDSFFDITYRIDFVGAPGGALDGLSGSTTATIRMESRSAETDSVEEDNGLGTATIPPEGGEFIHPDQRYMIIDGLPAGTTIELEPSHWLFVCGTTPCGVPGGGLGGEIESFESNLDLELHGTGALTDLQRALSIPVLIDTESGPRNPGDPIQVFATEMVSILGSLPPGDPDFDQLELTAGAANGLPSPGSGTLRDLGDGSFVVDSFFDITYRIDFVGAPDGRLDGFSGSTTADIRVTAHDRAGAPAHNITIAKSAEPQGPTVFDYTGLAIFSLDDDPDPTVPSRRTFNNLQPGAHTVAETPVAGWRLLRISCDDPDNGTTADLGTGEVTIDLDLGEAITCTFVSVTEIDLIFADGFECGDTTAW